MTIRPMRPKDRRAVLAMMRALWADASGALDYPQSIWVWESPEGSLGGFVSCSVRPFANGCETAPVPFVEGWYVAPALRRQGVGRALMAAVEAWAAGQGFAELGSDTETWRRRSIRVHQALGFQATERVQYFRKRLRKQVTGPAEAPGRPPRRRRHAKR